MKLRHWWFYWSPPWVIKRLVSLAVVALSYALFGLLIWAGYAVVDYLEDLPWGYIASGLAVIGLVACNWWQMDDVLWS